MYLIYQDRKFTCVGSVSSKKIVYSGLPDDFPAPVSGEIALCADDGFILRTDTAEAYLRQTFEDGVLTLTNVPEPEEAESAPIATPDLQADTDAMLIDHEYRLTLLELGLTE